MKSLLEESGYQEILERLQKLNENTKPQWGRMSVGQMAWHCQLPLKVAIKNKDSDVRSNPLVRWLFKRSMYSDKPWRKNLPTVPSFKATEPKDFKEELPKLLQLIEDFHQLKSREAWNPHPVFGTFTKQQWGQMQYKHLDHHLRQFDC